MESDILSLFLRHIAEQKAQIEQALATGAARDFNEYAKLTGQYAAYVDMESEVKDIEKRYLDD